MYSLQIALSDTAIAKELAIFSTKEKLFLSTNVLNTGNTTLTKFIANRPDALIIDSKIASSDGYRIVNLLPYLHFGKKICKIYILSNSPKNFANTELITSLKMPSSLEKFKALIKKIYREMQSETSLITIARPQNEKDWKLLLCELGFSISHIGTTYFSFTLQKHAYSTNTQFNIKELYEEIAQHFHISSINAKSAINRAMMNMKQVPKIANIYRILPVYDGREITVKYLFATLLALYGT